MADLAHVEQALVAAIAAALYPNSTASPSIIGAPARVYRGWPQPDALQRDLKIGQVHISVYSRPGMATVTTRRARQWEAMPSQAAATMAATVSGATATFSGTPASSMVAAIVTNGRTAATYRPANEDTLAAVATALAGQITGAVASGATVTVSDAATLVARVVGDVLSAREHRRQIQQFQATAWCPTPELRDAAAGAIDMALARVDRLTLADGTTARLTYRGSSSDDAPSRDVLYRRDLFYSVEFGTVEIVNLPAVAAQIETYGPANAPQITGTWAG